MDTLPEIQGKIEYMNASSGCNNESFFQECQRDATLETGFNVTRATADNVNLTLELENSSSGEWENWTMKTLEHNDDLFEGEIRVPDINTSAYEKHFRLYFNASQESREEIITREIGYKDFKVQDKSDSVTSKGSYRTRLEISKYFTPELLEFSRIEDSSIEIINPSGDQLTSFTVSDMDRRPDSGHFRNTVDLPLDSETGIYDMEVEVTNIYNETISDTFDFNVTDIQQTFTLNGGEHDLEKTISKTGNHSYNVSIQNEVDSETNISTSISDSLEDFTSVNGGDNISLDPEESKNVTVKFEVDSVDEYDGEIKFMDTQANYNETLDVEFNHVTCIHRNNSICITGADLNSSTNESGKIEKEFTATNFGEKNVNYNYSFSISGNITDYAELGKTETTLNTENDSETVNITYSPTGPGFYSGSLEIENEEDSINVPISLESNIESTDISIAEISDIKLGEIRRQSLNEI